MRYVGSSKRGFTLLEMMLSIAIIAIVSGCLYTLVFAIKDSYINTYNSDDSADYAMLYARAFENDFLSHCQEAGGGVSGDVYKWYVDDETTGRGGVPASLYRTVVAGSTSGLTSGTTKVFGLQMNKVNSGGSVRDKWKIDMEFGTSGGMITYKITVIDNYYQPGHIKCVYEGGFWLPHNDNGSVTFSDSYGVHNGCIIFTVS